MKIFKIKEKNKYFALNESRRMFYSEQMSWISTSLEHEGVKLNLSKRII